ncbi:MAG: family 20 glycosylhydrolase [Balneolales bacterium]
MIKTLRNILTILLLTISLSKLSAQDVNELTLMPLVNGQVQMGEGNFRVTSSLTVSVEGDPADRIYPEASRFLRRLSGRTGLFLPQDFITEGKQTEFPEILVSIKRPGELMIRENESYNLEVTDDKIILKAETDLGALHGFETILQLIEVDKEGYYIPSIIIHDEPRFTWRGLMIDGARHFMPVDVIKRNLDGMAAVKLNVFHWHLTEDQGFRVESKAFPDLHKKGSDGFYYSQEQIKDIIDYADDRGIRVVPEFDIPGHATSWLVGHPELATVQKEYEIERGFGIFDPTLDPTSEVVYDFLQVFLSEMAELFPDKYIHIGGDEVSGVEWNETPHIQSYMKSNNIPDNEALQAYFNSRIMEILKNNNKIMVGWEEILHPDLPNNIVIQSWHGRQSMVDAAKQGYQSILSNGYYIDLSQPTDFHYVNNPLPPDSPLTEEEKKMILGGEATMWSEFVSPETVDSRIWPRMAAIAEVFWSTNVPTINLPSSRDWSIPEELLTPTVVEGIDDMYRRLDVMSYRLEELGLTHKKNYPMMLRRLANGNDIGPVKQFIDVVEPVKIYNRPAQRKYTSYSPLTRTVDAARPDARVSRDFRRLVDDFLDEGGTDRVKADSIRKKLNSWERNHDDLVMIIELSPILEEIESLSYDLSRLSAKGIEALVYITENKKADKDWSKQALKIVEESSVPRGQVEIMVVSAVKKLIQTASN